MAKEISVRELASVLEDASAALLDVRETAEYNLAHIPGSVSLPRRLIEYRLNELVPWHGTRVIVCDDDGRRAALAAGTLERMGYTDVAVLKGGTNGWVTAGGDTEWGVNVPSKDFGEKVLLQQPVPEISPSELNNWLENGKRVVLVDSRTPEEHQRACIPGSRSMPGAELGLRIWELIDDPATPVVVHCAGRTRSIVGAGTLRKMGVENVFALKNGTMGWQLAGLELETGSSRLELPAPSHANAQAAATRARKLAADAGVRFVDSHEVPSVLASAAAENVYALDVRTREEYASGHIPGFRWAPGGQLVQATNSYVAVKAGVIILACDGFVRSSMTATWLREMGFPNVIAVVGGTSAWRSSGQALEAGNYSPPPFGSEAASFRVQRLPVADLKGRLGAASPPAVIFTGTSEEFSDAHLPAASWLPRGWLELRIRDRVPNLDAGVIVTSSDSDAVGPVLAAEALMDMGYKDVAVIDGGQKASRAVGFPLESGLAGVTQAPDDVLPARRSYAEMLNYLRWEEELGRKYKNAGSARPA
jgi:rhodanese-related sulfurtransferase